MSQEYLNFADCVGRQSLCFFPEWNEAVSLPAVIGGPVMYLIVTTLLRFAMRYKSTPFNPKMAMMLYNIVQIVLSSSMVIGLYPFLSNGVFNIGGKFCAKIEYWVFVHYISKYVDMLDTVFMILRKKDEQLTFLHVYHHSTIGTIWGILLHNGIGNGTAFWGAFINSFVHALMYTHYLWTSFGFRNPFKSLLTQFQMFQFFLCIVHAVLVILFDSQFTTGWAVLQLSYHMTLLYLFMQFHLKDVKKRGKKSKATSGKSVE